MDARRLSYFVCIVEEGSITAAARRLRLSQPALTKAMKTLEQELEVVLFERSLSRIVPTVFGESLLGHAKAVLAELERAQNDIAALRGMADERFRIGALPSLGGSILARGVAEVSARFPDLQIRIHENNSGALLRSLQRRELDLALLYSGNVSEDHGFVCETIAEDTLRIIVGRNHPLANSEEISIDDLVDHPWCTAVQGNWALLERMFQHAGRDTPKPRIDPGGSVQFLKSLVAEGRFLTLLPLHAMAAEIERGKLVPLPFESELFKRSIVALRPKDPELGPAGRAVLGSFKRAAAFFVELDQR